MKDKNLRIFDEFRVAIASVKMTRKRMFPLDLSIYLSKCLKTKIFKMTNLWHLRYEHLNRGSLMLMKKSKMVLGIPKLEHTRKICEVCNGKAAQKAVHKEEL